MSSIELLVCILLILVSGYMSASEIALFSLSRFQLRGLKERMGPAHRKIKRLLGDPGGLLITILVVNEIVNVALSAIIAGTISRSRKSAAEIDLWHASGRSPFFQWPSWIPTLPSWAVDTVLGILITSPIVLLFCEITPKVVAARANQLIAALTVGPLTMIYRALKPVRSVLKKVVNLASGIAGRGPQHFPAEDESGEKKPILKESDFLLMVEEGHKEGAIHESEMELIKNVFELDDTTVADVYTPLGQVRTLPSQTSLKSALLATRSLRYSRIPVVGPDRRKVLGILYSKDLLKAKLDPSLIPLTVEAVMRKPLFVNSSMQLNALFRKFKQQKTHMAIVQDSIGNSQGVVTMDDVLDALFDDLFPEEGEENQSNLTQRRDTP